MKDLGGHTLSWGEIRESVGKPERFLCWWPSGLCSCCCVACGLENQQGGAWGRNCEGRKEGAEGCKGAGSAMSTQNTIVYFATMLEELDLYF